MENNQQSFWQFSDQLRDQTNNSLANLSLNDSIWSNSYVSKKPERRNFDARVGAELNSVNLSNTLQAKKEPDFRNFDTRVGGELNAFKYHNFDKVDVSNTFKAKETNFGNGFQNFDTRVGSELNSVNSLNTLRAKDSNFNGFNHSWNIGGSNPNGFNLDWKTNTNPGFNNGVFANPSIDNKLDKNRNFNNVNHNVKTKGYYKKSEDNNNNNNNNNNNFHGAKSGKKNKNGNKDSNKDSEKDKDNKNSVDKRFKTLPPSESLPRNETIGGYIFVCNNDTMQENLHRQLFGLPPRYRDSVRSITPGLPLFLYNYSTHQLHGVYEAASFGGTNIDPSAWEDKRNPGESRFPAQVRVMMKTIYEPLEEDSFRPILHHYDGPKFRLELNIPEALSLLDIFSEN